MNKIKMLAVLSVCTLVIISCGGGKKRSVMLDFHNVPDTEACLYMKDVCRQAELFEGQFSLMSRDEKEDAKQILNAYIEQCEGAQTLCLQSGK